MSGKCVCRTALAKLGQFNMKEGGRFFTNLKFKELFDSCVLTSVVRGLKLDKLDYFWIVDVLVRGTFNQSCSVLAPRCVEMEVLRTFWRKTMGDPN